MARTRARGLAVAVVGCSSVTQLEKLLWLCLVGWRKGVMLVLVVWGVRVCAGHFGYGKMEECR